MIRALASSRPRRARTRRLLLDVDEGGLLPGEADLDVAGGELSRDLEGRLAEQVQKPEAGGGPEALAQPPGGSATASSPSAAIASRSASRASTYGVVCIGDVIMTSLNAVCQVSIYSRQTPPYACL